MSDYTLRERRIQAKVETHALDIAYWELLRSQYRRKDDTDGEKPTDNKNEREEDVIIEDIPAELQHPPGGRTKK